jgi:hypothetical protein
VSPCRVSSTLPDVFGDDFGVVCWAVGALGSCQFPQLNAMFNRAVPQSCSTCG